MRKQQIKLIEKAKKHKFTDTQLQIIQNENYTIEELQIAYNYFLHTVSETPDLLTEEVINILTYLRSKRDTIKNAKDYILLLNILLPSHYNQSDVLLGNKKKKRIVKMYWYLQKYMSNYGDHYRSLLYGYNACLKNNISDYHVSLIFKEMLKNPDKYNLAYKFNEYPCLIDDFKHNGKQSMFYYLGIEKDYVSHFNWYFSNFAKQLENLYDYQTHQFCFFKEEVDDVLILNNDRIYPCYQISSTYIYQYNLTKYPIASILSTFCETNQFYNKTPDSLNKIYRKQELFHPKEYQTLIDGYQILKQGYTIQKQAYALEIKICSNFFTNVIYTEYDTIYVGADNEDHWVGHKKTKEYEFLISPDGYLFLKLKYQRKNQKYIPLNFKYFIQMYQHDNLLSLLMKTISDFHIQQNYFYKDMIQDCLQTGCIIPLSFNEISMYHNKKELLLNKYKIAALLPIKWNKQNINLSYLIIKASSHVEPTKSKQILIQQKDLTPIMNGDYYKKSYLKGYEYLKQIILQNIVSAELKKIDTKTIKEKYTQELLEQLETQLLPDEYEQWCKEKLQKEVNLEELQYLVSDYISMCRQSKLKIRLDIHTRKQLEKIHNRIQNNHYQRNTQAVKIPKDSKFLNLRKILPKEFEWIKTKKRLVLETEFQHHCVWSYAPYITADKCAIYSFVDKEAKYDKEPKRYTIEFCINHGKYYINQVQGKYNAANTTGIKSYIQYLLDLSQTKQSA